MTPIVGVDIDGVLADWNDAFRRTLVQATGRVLIPEGFDPPLWNYAQFYGYTAEEERTAYRMIATDSFFWQNLKPLPGAEYLATRLMRLAWETRIDLYFVTARSGVQVKYQTERWLHNTFGFRHNTVLICPGDKVEVATALRMTHFLDDKFETALGMAHSGVFSFLPRRAYNRDADTHPTIHQLPAGDYTDFLLAVQPLPLGAAA